MNFTFHKPICFFDLETTGVNVSKDRIVEISMLKWYPNGNKESKTLRVNPTIPIPPETSAVHGIYDADVANEPTFQELAPQVLAFIKDSDLAGFNSNRFDIPLLAEELLRAGMDFDARKHKTIDVQVIFHKKEPRNLSAAYKFYCQKDLENAHSAAADTEATYEIFRAQMERYEDLGKDLNEISRFSSYKRNADLAGFIGLDDSDEPIFNFGKYKGKQVKEVLASDAGYFGWIQNADFPLYTKKVLTAIQLQTLT